MGLHPYLIVLRGFPYDEGTTLQIQSGNVILGRKNAQLEPDIGFENVFVSRKQASIYYDKGSYYIMDLESKHGTEVNGNRLIPFTPALLKSSDNISLARGAIYLTFSTKLWEETMDFMPYAQQADLSPECQLDPVRQTMQLRGRSYHFSDKEYRCLEILARNVHQFVGRDELVNYVWPERADDESTPSAGSEEVNSLLYRLRKKTNHAIHIESIRGKGYILTFSGLVEKSV
ncbi:FHA domain-containing protein [Cohnella endophytica]|uniref:FHA domain-containing protein n=1 Tax=Cohnella endophytica TaxID=2419778 RepID=A0A494Y604_9BACL|nr:FHA domain-containing protein [Cohnella endophytica]RKP58099.1 FHA domain-containing protein [Cohnella endophytica]